MALPESTTGLAIGERLFRQLAENSPDTILILEWPGPHTIYFNRGDFLGYSAEEIRTPRPVLEQVHPEDAALVRQQWEAAQQGEVQTIECRIKHKAGHWEWVQSRAKPLQFTSEGQIQQLLYTITLITGRKHAEEELRANEQRFRALIENSLDLITVQDANFSVTYVSPSVEKFVNLPASEMVGKVGINLGYVHPDDLARLQRSFAAAFGQPGVPQPPTEYQIHDLHGQWRVLETVIVNLLHDPAVNGIVVNARDITQRREAERALRESEARYRLILQQSLDAIFITDTKAHTLLEANPAFFKLFGYSPEDMGRLTYYELVVASRESIDQNVTRIRQHGQYPVGERIYRHADGSHTPVDVSASILTLDGEEVIVTVVRDISERKQREQELAQRTAELAALYRASARLLNPGEDVEQLAQQIADALTQEFEFADCGLLLVDEAAGELKRLARAGPYEVRTSAPLYLTGKGLTISAVQTNQLVYAPDVTQDPRYIPNESRTRSELAVPLRSSGKVIGVLDLQSIEPNAFDERALRIITAFAERAELALANALLVERLSHSRRLAEDASRLKSEFLANTSHELRTPLTGILGSLSLILNDECETTEEAKQFAQIAYDSARNLLSIVNDLLDVAKIEAGKMNVQLQLIEVSSLLAEVYMLMWTTANRKQLEFRIPALSEPVYVWADNEKLKQILINLIGNAIKFTEHGYVSVNVSTEEPLVKISVRDTGIGVPPEKQALLFRPFVQVDGTTTRRYGGTGLGLSISRSLAQLLGGSITLESAGEGMGSTFTLTLYHADPNSPALPRFA